MKVREEILNILEECYVDGNMLYLPDRLLDRKIYLEVNKCLENIGGKWNRKLKDHLFDSDPKEALAKILHEGESVDPKKEFQFFPTPKAIAEQMCDMAGLDENSIVLEPHCGRGDLADVIYDYGVSKVYGVELNPEMLRFLEHKPYEVLLRYDFLEFAVNTLVGIFPNEWTHIIMNPPLSKQQDIDHIKAAYEMLKPGGVLVSIVGPSPFFRTNKKSVEFVDWLDTMDSEIISLPKGAFKESGTMVQTNLLRINKPALKSNPVEHPSVLPIQRRTATAKKATKKPTGARQRFLL